MTCLEIPASSFVIVTFAPDTRPSELSRTVPETVATPVCENAGKTPSPKPVERIRQNQARLQILRTPNTRDSMFTSPGSKTRAPGKLQHRGDPQLAWSISPFKRRVKRSIGTDSTRRGGEHANSHETIERVE